MSPKLFERLFRTAGQYFNEGEKTALITDLGRAQDLAKKESLKMQAIWQLR